MELTGSRTIEASRAATWAVLTDVDALGTCGPGGLAIERVDERHARIRMTAGSGFLATKVTIDFELDEVVAPDRVALAARGQAAGTVVEGHGSVELDGPSAGPTTLAWRVDLAVSGSMAGIASRLIESEAGRRLDGAIDCVRSLATAHATG